MILSPANTAALFALVRPCVPPERWHLCSLLAHQSQLGALPTIEFRQAVNAVTRCEKQLTGGLSEAERMLLDELVEAQQEIDSITAVENFIPGFRLGVRLMVECMDENDGEIMGVTDHG